MLTLDGTPYVLSFSAEREIKKRIGGIEARVVLLRSIGKLSPDTLRRYYGEKRFEQIAESNAIEGSTLSVGETQAAVLKGITLTGHDPAYVRDARSLDAALSRVVELSKDTSRATDITQLAEVHALIMGDRPGGGIFRSEMVKISGSSHTPPKTWKLVMEGMEAWEAWSIKYKEAPAPFRAATLHAWLTHIHPFMDGNGRASRAIMNLELIRAGYPPIIVRKKERDRYIDSLSQSDSGGDILAFLELILERTDGALSGLETSASEKQEYSPVVAKLRKNQSLQLEVWRKSVELLSSRVDLNLNSRMANPAVLILKKDFEGIADLEDFLTLCKSQSVGRSWAFRLSVRIHGFGRHSFLAYIGHRSFQMISAMGGEGGPSLYWSIYDEGYERKWRSVTDEAPFFKEATISLNAGDNWTALTVSNTLVALTTAELAEKVSIAIESRIANDM